MNALSTKFHSQSADDTARLAVMVGGHLKAGDSVLLSGGIGAGKSHFARALISSRLAEPEDIPSPTFTLIQTYALEECELWHADLYRLTDPDQIVELGLLEAFENAITLIEWPDRLAELAPETALQVNIEDIAQNDTRAITLKATDPRWKTVLDEVIS